jgi:serine kinase of HPr protein (carbohydrate metabolism regulator)
LTFASRNRGQQGSERQIRSASASIHASAVKIGERAVLIRGPSGAGKSRLAFDLILAGRSGLLPNATLVGDDRVRLDTVGGELWASPVEELAGLIEIRGLGIRRMDFASDVVVGLVVDLAAGDAERLPPSDAFQISISGVLLPRIPVESSFSPLPLVVAALTTTESSCAGNLSDHCQKGIGNHITPTIATE